MKALKTLLVCLVVMAVPGVTLAVPALQLDCDVCEYVGGGKLGDRNISAQVRAVDGILYINHEALSNVYRKFSITHGFLG